MSTRVTVTSGDLYARAEAAAQKAAKEALNELFGAMQQSFTAKAWPWPRDLPTRKLGTKGGATLAEKLRSYRAGEGVRGGSPRNLIDFKNLRDTGVPTMLGPYQARFTWSAEYAAFVHEGGVIWAWGRRPPKKGARAVLAPARPWTRAVLGQEIVSGIKPFPLQQRVKDVWLAYFKSKQR